MKRTTLLAPAVAGALALAGCGSTQDAANRTDASTAPAPVTTSAPAAAPATTSAVATAAVPADTCPTESTRAFAKTRFVADVGLAAGTFHRWIWTPYQEGRFAQGAEGRTLAIAKALGVAALDAKLVTNAYENVQADPTLCRALGAPLGKLKGAVDTMTADLKRGDLSSVAAVEPLVGAVIGASQQQGMKIVETTDTSVAP